MAISEAMEGVFGGIVVVPECGGVVGSLGAMDGGGGGAGGPSGDVAR